MYTQISKHKTLVENANNVLFEAYEDRVRQVAQNVLQSLHGQPVTKDSLRAQIERHQQSVPLGSLPVAEFVKDVLKELGNQVQIKRAPGTPGAKTQARQELKNLIEQLASEIPSIVGDSFPDGDPIDGVIDWSRKHATKIRQIQDDMGQDHMETKDFFWHMIWPRAEKMFAAEHRVKDLNEYLADMWDEYSGDNSPLELDRSANPWKPR